jgi:membrane fusion protein, multidrug efflux system
MRKVPLVIAVIVVIGGSIYGWPVWEAGRFSESTDDAYVKADMVQIAPRVTALVVRVLVTDNQRVRKGDLLVQLDDRDFLIALAEASASRAVAEAETAVVRSQLRLQESAIEQARAELSATTAEELRARADANRYQSLAADNWVSAQRAQQAVSDQARASSQKAKAAAALEGARRQLDVISAKLSQVEAQALQAGAAEDAARLNLSFCQVSSPVDGVVGNRSARGGAYATAGAALLSIVPASGLWVEANFKEDQLANIRTSQPVTVWADALNGAELHGRVSGLAPATGAEFALLPPENATGNFTKIVQRVPVRIDLEGAAAELGALRPGLSVVTRIDTRDHSSQNRDAPALSPAGAPLVAGLNPEGTLR